MPSDTYPQICHRYGTLSDVLKCPNCRYNKEHCLLKIEAKHNILLNQVDSYWWVLPFPFYFCILLDVLTKGDFHQGSRRISVENQSLLFPGEKLISYTPWLFIITENIISLQWFWLRIFVSGRYFCHDKSELVFNYTICYIAVKMVYSLVIYLLPQTINTYYK